MAIWNNNNRACTTLWTSLFTMHQLISKFDDSGDIKMKDLTFYNPLNSSELRMQDAAILADHLDKVFQARGAKYEAGVDANAAVNGLINILIDGEKCVKDLAEAADTFYIFWHEYLNT